MILLNERMREGEKRDRVELKRPLTQQPSPSNSSQSSSSLLFSSGSSVLDQAVPPGNCKHLQGLKRLKGADYLLEQYSIIVEHFVTTCSPVDRRRRAYSAVCSQCRERSRLHVCLLCVHLACHHSPRSSHILAHASSTGPQQPHSLAVDLSYGQLFCCDCKDYIYDEQFSSVLHQFSNRARVDLGLPALTPSWEPSSEEIELLKQHPKRRKLASHLTIGLRGLLNLGSTCFMNSILQCLVHTPLIRDYFLSEQHRCVGSDAQSACLGCEIAATFKEFYSGLQQPYIPSKLLHIVWKHAKHLAGYEQQDAHEFVVAILDIMHEHLTRNNNNNSKKSSSSASSTCSNSSASSHNNNNNSNNGKEPCQCIIHKVFTGLLQSTVTCNQCHQSRQTIDPFWDISLDLHQPSASSNPQSPVEACSSLVGGDSGGPLTLHQCLLRFTRSERLSGAKLECAVCHATKEDWSKQLTFKQLPLVVCFHLKRFSGSVNGSHRKISDRVAFPLDLDLTPFTTHAKSGCSLPTPAGDALHHESNSYSLFGVVSHTGQQIDNGHYVSFVRNTRHDWFKCDDHLVTPVKPHDVLAAEGYLLFYHKKLVDYASSSNVEPTSGQQQMTTLNLSTTG